MDVFTTIGPVSWSPETMRALVQLGVRGVRFPFAKETPSDHIARLALLKSIALTLGVRMISIADLPGAKPRLSNRDVITVSSQELYRIALSKKVSRDADLFLEPPISEVTGSPGTQVCVGDGENRFLIRSLVSGVLHGHFETDGRLERRQAFLPRCSDFTVAPFPAADREIAAQALRAGFDWLALSFVESATAMEDARQWCEQTVGRIPPIVAKIETAAGLRQIRAIVAVADVIMVARGDLAISVGIENLWHAQRAILQAAKSQQRYVIATTGFLEGFQQRLGPSRAEAIDVCAALDYGADAVMLTGETTIGRYPIEAVKSLQQIGDAWGAGNTDGDPRKNRKTRTNR